MKTEIVEAWIMLQLLDIEMPSDTRFVAVDESGEVYGFRDPPIHKKGTSIWDSLKGNHWYLCKLPMSYKVDWIDWDCTVFEI